MFFSKKIGQITWICAEKDISENFGQKDNKICWTYFDWELHLFHCTLKPTCNNIEIYNIPFGCLGLTIT